MPEAKVIASNSLGGVSGSGQAAEAEAAVPTGGNCNILRRRGGQRHRLPTARTMSFGADLGWPETNLLGARRAAKNMRGRVLRLLPSHPRIGNSRNHDRNYRDDAHQHGCTLSFDLREPRRKVAATLMECYLAAG
jgi:hypothetical protein